jgi:putative tryptophan/tyrosine transport system substrate-binding protein
MGMMHGTTRRSKIFRFALCAMLFALCHPVEAQQPTKIPRIGYLAATDPATESTRAEAIRLAMRERGYIEGQNIATEYRYAEGKLDWFPELAAELVRLKVDIILVSGDRPILAAKNATKTIPIVMLGQGSIRSRLVLLKASPVPAATSPALLSLTEN